VYVCMYLCEHGRSVLGLRPLLEEKRRASAAVFPVSQCLLIQTLHSHAHTLCWSLYSVIVAETQLLDTSIHSHSVTTPPMIFSKFVDVHNRRNTVSSSCFPPWLELAVDTTVPQLTGCCATHKNTLCQHYCFPSYFRIAVRTFLNDNYPE
jgi:hypothetical protein